MQEDFYESVSKPLKDKKIFEMAKDYAFDYMDGISQRHVYPKAEDRVCWCGQTQWKGNYAIRLSVCSWATTEKDIELCIDSFKRGIEYTKNKR